MEVGANRCTWLLSICISNSHTFLREKSRNKKYCRNSSKDTALNPSHISSNPPILLTKVEVLMSNIVSIFSQGRDQDE